MTLVVVTGSNTGIGRVTALELAKRGHELVLACRSEAKTTPVLDEIRQAGGKAEFLALDLADLDQVAAAAKQLLGKNLPIQVLVNNAGVAGHQGETAQGYELTFGVNHLGTYLFTRLLLPRLLESERPRVVTVASKAHYQSKGIDWDIVRGKTRALTGLPEYEHSKLCNVLFAKQLAKREPKLASVSLHPGVVASDIWRRIPWPFRALYKLTMISNEEGAKTSVHCATAEDVWQHPGGYYDLSAPKTPSRYAEDPALAELLWTRSEEWTSAWLQAS